MNTIGLLGGMSWESTASYYRLLNEGVRRELGGLHSARIALVSVDFEPLEALQHADDWAAIARLLTRHAQQVEAAGADLLLICTNTMHKVADEIDAGVNIPLLHIADATAAALRADGIERVGLLGTRFTMEQDFYRDRLRERHGLDVLVPGAEERGQVHRVIYDELCLGDVRAASRRIYLDVIDALAARGAQAVILGCTEIALLVTPGDTPVRLYDTTTLHVEAAIRAAL